MSMTDAEVVERLRVHGVAYEAMKNPVHAWWSILLCHRYGMQLPGWVMQYLAFSALNITRVETEAAKGCLSEPMREAEHAGRAIGFGRKAKGKLFSQRPKFLRDRVIYFKIEVRRGDAPTISREVYEQTAREYGLTPAAVKKVHRRMRELDREDSVLLDLIC